MLGLPAPKNWWESNELSLQETQGASLIEQHDEWDAADRRYFSENSMKLLNRSPEGVLLTELEAA